MRIAGLFTAIALAMAAIGWRLAHIQVGLAEEYAAEFEKTIDSFEPIPSRDGRILAADGEVLAEDQEVFGLKVHYRWLEEPADPRWLKAQALASLDRPGRRDSARVALEQKRVLRRRADLWRNIARATGWDAATLASRRREIQRRVEKIYAGVERRREEQNDEASTQVEETQPAAAWERVWQKIVGALTTPPVRDAPEPLVIREQLAYHTIIGEMPLATAVEVEAHPESYPGARIAVTTRRIYPHGDTAPHVVGYRTPLDDDAIKDRKRLFPQGDPLDYQSGDPAGRTGLERFYERHLRGLRGLRRLVLDRRGELLRTETVREPRFGKDLVLSLNLPLQRAAERLLDQAMHPAPSDEPSERRLPVPAGGAIVALDVRTGAVLAAASEPRFNLQVLADSDEAAWERIVNDPRKPLFHRAAEMALPPGSVFKVLSAIAFLDSGRLDPAREFHCQGYLDDPESHRCLIYRNFGASHGDINLVDALARSCNVYFFAAARRAGASPIIDWAVRFGFGRPTGIDLPGERGGNLPILKGEASPTRRGRTKIASGDALQLAIGQAKLTATPLQIARLLAAVANGGRLITPRLAESAGPASIETIDSFERLAADAAAPIPELSENSLAWVRRGLERVVADPHGTGYKTVRLDALAIAGKTGTAEPGGGKPDHAWFAGYVPADRPKIAFVVVLENAGSGGHAAGPLARQLVQAMLALDLLGRQTAAPSAN